MPSQRPHGAVHPGIKWGRFTLRIPGIHVDLTPSTQFQGGLLLLATGGATAPLLMQYFGVSFEIAWTVMLVMFFWVFAQTFLFGDVYSAGGIAAGLPLTIIFLNDFSPGPEAIRAMIAVTLVVSFLFLFFGITRLGERFNRLVPATLKAGIIMGAAVAAFQSELDRLERMPFTLITAWVVVLALMFSAPFARLPNSRLKMLVGANALLVAFMAAGVVGLISGELRFDIEWGLFVPPLRETLDTLAPWSVGLPSWGVIASAIPIGVMIYILAFGDLLVADTLLKGADKARSDEKLDIDHTRSHYVLAIRNLAQLVTAGPLVMLHGPIWTGVQVFLIERYKQGRTVMDSLFTGTTNFYLLAIPLGMLMPVLGLIMPMLPVALSVTIVLTGFACAYVAMAMVQGNIERGLVLTIGMLTAVMGPAWGIGAGILLYFLMLGRGGERAAEPVAEEDVTESLEGEASYTPPNAAEGERA
ncbi:hypothetical protein PRZ61_07505 [Halomonas pacifica]|uniref:hypothetical protein n=1 Tax=Bisbaumannia pacifica TaxID=77098 RepID=UPI002359B2FB|nr:hypothetical protein [Halomonas pacifica]MDC8803290.1 hypothetical protein [Halomonas pacifica]